MKLDLSKLTDAVTKVAGLAASHATISSAHDDLAAANAALIADQQASQDAIDHLTASLLAATTTPAEAVGIAAVAAAVAAPIPAAPVVAPVATTVIVAPAVPADAVAAPAAPLTVDELNARIAAANAAPATH